MAALSDMPNPEHSVSITPRSDHTEAIVQDEEEEVLRIEWRDKLNEIEITNIDGPLSQEFDEEDEERLAVALYRVREEHPKGHAKPAVEQLLSLIR